MSGKSAILRQTALIVPLAQNGVSSLLSKMEWELWTKSREGG
jgi:hypothetical protein